MRMQKIKVLLIEDDAEDADLLQEILSERNAHLFELEWVKRLRIGIERLTQGGIDVVLLDLSLPDSQGMDTLKRIQAEVQSSVPIVVLSGLDDESMAFTAVQLGAQDYLVKGEVDNRLLVRSLRYAIERKQASESLRLLEAAVSASVDGITICDPNQPDDPLIYVSPGFEGMTGYSRQEVLGKNCRFLQRGDHDQPGLDKIRHAMKTGEKCRVILRNYHKDGTLFWNELTIYPLHDSSGHLTHFVGVQHDITSHKQAEKDLRRRETILEAVSFAAERLLKTTNWKESLHSVFVHLGQATNASNVRIFKQEKSSDNKIVISRQYEWLAHNQTQPLGENLIWEQTLLDPVGLERWLTTLSKGNIIHGHVSEFPANEQKRLLEQGIRSIVAVPIFVGDKWWGFINFDSYNEKQDWSDPELDAITAAVNTLGAAMQRQQVLSALQDSESRYRSIVNDHQTELICRWRPDGQLTFVNEAYCRYFSKKREELVGHSFIPLIPEEDQLLVAKELASLNQDKPVSSYEHRVILQNGEMRWQQWTDLAIFNDVGNIIEYQAVGQDITQRKKAEEALRESEERFRNIFEKGPLGMCLIGLDYSFLKVNAALCNLVEYSEDELIGKSFLHITHHEDKKISQVLFTRKTQISQLEKRYITKSGKVIWINLTCAVINDHDGNPLYSLAMSEDITERKLAKTNLERERALLAKRVEERTAKLSIANAQLARAARLKDEFLANMSHELRTPLNAILGLCETLQEELVGKLNSDQHEYLQGITSSGRHLLSLINDILDIAKIEAGKVQLDLGIVIVEDVSRTSLSFIKQIATKKRLYISYHIDKAASTILADERRLKQILVNLLSNAVKFTPERGKVGLEVVQDEANQTISFTVSDTGIGIAEEELSGLFDPFIQVDSVLSRQYNGTGLGLALVRHLTEMHGGTVSVESEVNVGSHFTVVLPIRTTEMRQFNQSNGYRDTLPIYTPKPSLNEPRINVLLAEDNDANIFTISSYLRSKGFCVTVARNGEDAIAQVKENNLDLVLMDIQMPKMNGLDAIRHIRADQTVTQIPIIALTAFAMPGDRDRCLQAGANEYLSKPVRLKTLVHTIKKLAKHNQSSDNV